MDFITVGLTDEQREAIGALPAGHGILGALIVEPVPLRLPDLREHPASYGFPPNHPAMTSFLGVPIMVREEVFGNLYLCDKLDGDTFTDVDEELATGLATAAGMAIDNARMHALTSITDRERIARDLHDSVIQRLFAIGMGLQATIPLMSEPRAIDRVVELIDELDLAVREVRSAVFQLNTARLPGRSVRHELLTLCADASRALGFEPLVSFDGPIDTVVDDELATDVVAVVRESLSNVARHAHALHAQVAVAVDHEQLVVQVDDDGVGAPSTAEPAAGHGLRNLRTRAERHLGALHVGGRSPTGTKITWSVPLGGSRI